MAYRFDPYDNAIVLEGWENGIADSPHLGISNMRNINIVSVPGEGSVNFSVTPYSAPTVTTGTVTSANTGTDKVLYTGATNLDSRMCVVFTGASLPTGITAGTFYWTGAIGAGEFSIYTELSLDNLVNITATGTGTFEVIAMGQPKHMVYDTSNLGYWMVDANGRVWTDLSVTGSGSYWTFTGNKINNFSAGNGLAYYEASDGGTSLPVGYIFVFSKGSIDWTIAGTSAASLVWQYGWNPSTGVAAGYSATPTQVLKTRNGQDYSHETLLAPDNRLYFCDSNWIGRFYQTSPSTLFNPASTATYTYDQTALLPGTDRANCLTFLGTNLLIGGIRNIIYPWDRFNTNFSYPLLLPEYNVSKMVTVNTNTFIFMGNRGRIYFTNGTNVQLYKKLPDHISGTVEPYFTWGGATSVKNQLYFSALCTTNAGTSISQYGGLWAIDLDNGAIRLANKLSYGTYAGYATAMIPNFSASAAGTGIFIGWDSGASTYGIDRTISTPYTSSEATIDTDLIPIGTFNHPRDATYIEYRLTKPLVSGESITIKTRLIFNTSDTGFTTTLTDSTVGNYSSSAAINYKNAQWVQFQIVLNSTASSPSYVRLKEIRLAGIQGITSSTAPSPIKPQ